MNESTCEVCQFGQSPIWHENCPDVHRKNTKNLRSQLDRACELLRQADDVSQAPEWPTSAAIAFDEWKDQIRTFLSEVTK